MQWFIKVIIYKQGIYIICKNNHAFKFCNILIIEMNLLNYEDLLIKETIKII